mmetsp:Transcript_6605/g.18658  ORF Transcript_6605/g.18658 Transcript_6605/m.18658 type:complete len:335 (-) Transcript_6605:264-1268(-)
MTCFGVAVTAVSVVVLISGVWGEKPVEIIADDGRVERLRSWSTQDMSCGAVVENRSFACQGLSSEQCDKVMVLGKTIVEHWNQSCTYLHLVHVAKTGGVSLSDWMKEASRTTAGLGLLSCDGYRNTPVVPNCYDRDIAKVENRPSYQHSILGRNYTFFLANEASYREVVLRNPVYEKEACFLTVVREPRSWTVSAVNHYVEHHMAEEDARKLERFPLGALSLVPGARQFNYFRTRNFQFEKTKDMTKRPKSVLFLRFEALPVLYTMLAFYICSRGSTPPPIKTRHSSYRNYFNESRIDGLAEWVALREGRDVSMYDRRGVMSWFRNGRQVGYVG